MFPYDSESCDSNKPIEILTNNTLTDFVFWPVSKQVNSWRVNEPLKYRAGCQLLIWMRFREPDGKMPGVAFRIYPDQIS